MFGTVSGLTISYQTMAQFAKYGKEARPKTEANSTLRTTMTSITTPNPNQLSQVRDTCHEMKLKKPGLIDKKDAPRHPDSESPLCHNESAKNSTTALPPWALAAATTPKHLSQPWKLRYGNDPDDPNFAAERDTIRFYDPGMKVCYSESSMAA